MKKDLTNFLLTARTKTYAGNKGKVKSALEGSKQLEYSEGEWLYRDIYYAGNSIFSGLETTYYKNEPVWSMSYFGNFKEMTEEQMKNYLAQKKFTLTAKKYTSFITQAVS